jgi:hypothetical protein
VFQETGLAGEVLQSICGPELIVSMWSLRCWTRYVSYRSKWAETEDWNCRRTKQVVIFVIKCPHICYSVVGMDDLPFCNPEGNISYIFKFYLFQEINIYFLTQILMFYGKVNLPRATFPYERKCIFVNYLEYS